VERKTKGTMILRSGGRFYKVLKMGKCEKNAYLFECKDLRTRDDKVFQFRLSGFLEVVEHAFEIMKSPKDIFFLDLDRDGEWKIVSEDQLKNL
jgi:hypothetical protein